ncbi:50S ribosomal protein L6 [Candidatus Parcubacteria bacterium]|nr:50S ribosomal protein L6 [Candidatus Parcubacteria bacterium]
MSRIGKQPIEIPAGIEIEINSGFVIAKGAKGELKTAIHPKIKVEKKENQIIVSISNQKDREQRALWGLSRTLIANMIEGLNKGFEKKLEVNGVGYKINLSGQKLILNVGYSHPVEFELPSGINGKVENNTIIISGFDKQLVGETAARIRKIRKPEPYKGKGIKYSDEIIRRKAGKVAAKSE